MTKVERCPNCRSTFEVNGYLNFGASKIQVIGCPVCSQEIWMPAGLLPQSWTVGQVITREKVTTKPTITPAPSATDTEPFTADIEIPGVKAVQSAGRGIYNAGMWALWMVILLLALAYKDEIKSLLREVNNA